jgi:ATPase subunit of ABC transporter with duplicated ATPase domains
VDELVTWFNQMDATYRQDVRDLNELNFARFDAKLEQRAAELKAKIEQRAAELRTEIARLEGGLLSRIGLAEGRLARLTLLLWMGTLGTLIALLKL